MRRIARLLLLALVALLPLAGAGEGDDGPFVFWEGRRARVLRMVDGRPAFEAAEAPLRLELPGLLPGPLVLDGRPHRPGPVRLPEPARILAVSDVHGELDKLRTLLRAHGAVSPEGRWTFGTGHVVMLGDAFDRGPRHTEILWFLRGLEPQARKAGGRLHVLLGNHEAMVLGGDLRYLHPRYQALRRGAYPADYPALFGPETELGRWLRARPAVLKLGPWLFVHGGISPELLARDLSLEELDRAVRADLDAGGKTFLLGRDGPLWYRGLVPGGREQGDAPAGHVEAVLARYGARALVLGHTSQDRVRVFHEGRVLVEDAGIADGTRGEVLILEKGKRFRGLPDGRRIPLEEAGVLRPAA